MGFLIRRPVLLFSALFLLVSCNQGGGKIKSTKEQSAQTATKSAPTVKSSAAPAPKPAAASKKVKTAKATAPRKKASSFEEQTGEFNGVTQFNAR